MEGCQPFRSCMAWRTRSSFERESPSIEPPRRVRYRAKSIKDNDILARLDCGEQQAYQVRGATNFRHKSVVRPASVHPVQGCSCSRLPVWHWRFLTLPHRASCGELLCAQRDGNTDSCTVNHPRKDHYAICRKGRRGSGRHR